MVENVFPAIANLPWMYQGGQGMYQGGQARLQKMIKLSAPVPRLFPFLNQHDSPQGPSCFVRWHVATKSFVYARFLFAISLLISSPNVDFYDRCFSACLILRDRTEPKQYRDLNPLSFVYLVLRQC